MFLLDDTQLINEAFLEDVNGILNTGEVPSLFNNEEMVAINEALTKPAQVRHFLPATNSEFEAETRRRRIWRSIVVHCDCC